MPSDYVAALGYGSVALISGSSVPQVIKTIATGSARDISWGYLTMFITGCSLGAAYGFLAGAVPVAIGNIATLAGFITLAVAKLHGSRDP
jgi:uncharacterized protein with PQ loop repeat